MKISSKVKNTPEKRMEAGGELQTEGINKVR